MKQEIIGFALEKLDTLVGGWATVVQREMGRFNSVADQRLARMAMVTAAYNRESCDLAKLRVVEIIRLTERVRGCTDAVYIRTHVIWEAGVWDTDSIFNPTYIETL